MYFARVTDLVDLSLLDVAAKEAPNNTHPTREVSSLEYPIRGCYLLYLLDYTSIALMRNLAAIVMVG